MKGSKKIIKTRGHNSNISFTGALCPSDKIRILVNLITSVAKFVNTAVQPPELRQLLPIEPSQFTVDSDEIKINSAGYEY